jgi:hypothetical protein
VWKKNFGGSAGDYFTSISLVSDGFIAVGDSDPNSFGTGDWNGISGKGDTDATIVKFNFEGSVIWKKNFGGNSVELFQKIITVPDGVVAAGLSSSGSFGNGDWVGISGKGGIDAIIVKFDNAGNVVWKKNFGGSADDFFYGLGVDTNGFLAVGYSDAGSFGNGDWEGITGSSGAIIVKYVAYIGVIDIVNVPVKAVIGTPLPLTGKIMPENATYQTIEWSVSSAGTTGAVIIDKTLYVTAEGTALILATIKNGKTVSDDFTKLFFIEASTVGISETGQEANKITIYPNPTIGNLYVESDKLKVSNVEIFDVYGRIVLSSFAPAPLINISHLTAGVYFLKISTEVGQVIKKVLKE